MDKIKPYFVTPYLLGTMALGILSVVKLATDSFQWGWLGIALTTWPILTFLGGTILSLFKGASVRIPIVFSLGFIGVALSLYGFVSAQEPPVLVGLALTAMIGLLLYELWFARFGRSPVAALRAGRALPDFPLEREDGSALTSHHFIGSPAIFLFYRGNWCPLCMAQIREIAGQYQDLAARGAQIVLISPQSHEQTGKLAAKYEVPFHFLVDAGNKAAVQLGIAHPDGLPAGMGALGYDKDLVMPTVIITDATGTILFADETDDYRVRPEPETFLAVLDGTLKTA